MRLPSEIILKIYEYCDYETRININKICKWNFRRTNPYKNYKFVKHKYMNLVSIGNNIVPCTIFFRMVNIIRGPTFSGKHTIAHNVIDSIYRVHGYEQIINLDQNFDERACINMLNNIRSEIENKTIAGRIIMIEVNRIPNFKKLLSSLAMRELIYKCRHFYFTIFLICKDIRDIAPWVREQTNVNINTYGPMPIIDIKYIPVSNF